MKYTNNVRILAYQTLIFNRQKTLDEATLYLQIICISCSIILFFNEIRRIQVATHYYSSPLNFSKAGIKKVVKEQCRIIKKYKTQRKSVTFQLVFSLSTQNLVLYQKDKNAEKFSVVSVVEKILATKSSRKLEGNSHLLVNFHFVVSCEEIEHKLAL